MKLLAIVAFWALVAAVFLAFTGCAATTRTDCESAMFDTAQRQIAEQYYIGYMDALVENGIRLTPALLHRESVAFHAEDKQWRLSQRVCAEAGIK